MENNVILKGPYLTVGTQICYKWGGPGSRRREGATVNLFIKINLEETGKTTIDGKTK